MPSRGQLLVALARARQRNEEKKKSGGIRCYKAPAPAHEQSSLVENWLASSLAIGAPGTEHPMARHVSDFSSMSVSSDGRIIEELGVMAPPSTPPVSKPTLATEANDPRSLEDAIIQPTEEAMLVELPLPPPVHHRHLLEISETVPGTSAEAQDFHFDPVEGMGSTCGRTAYVPAMTALQRKTRRQRGLPNTNSRDGEMVPNPATSIPEPCLNTESPSWHSLKDTQNQPSEEVMFVELPLPAPVHHRHLLEFDETVAQDLNITVDGMGLSGGRTSYVPAMTASQRKNRRQRGLPYTNRKHQDVAPPQFQYITCKCANDCSDLTLEMRRQMFDDFWRLGSWDAQSSFLRSTMTEICVKDHRHTPNARQRSTVVKYSLNNGVRVCKKVLASSLGISPMRLDYIRTKKTRETGIISPDKRGKKNPANKTHSDVISAMREFLDSIPKYSSHYSNNNRTYFHPDLTKKKLYELYCDGHPDKIVSYGTFIKIFHEYQVAIYKPRKDTCAKCDLLNARMKSELTKDERDSLAEEATAHRQRADAARAELKIAEKEARADSNVLTISFDMEKTQPIPYINTSVAFYKRQLWLYNLGINNRKDNSATMCIWTEPEGKRGSNEVASALYEFLQAENVAKYKNIRSFSDGCGGQNKNKTIISFFMFICRTTTVESWTHVFLEPGHSYLPNDTDFGKIERKKNARQYIYTFEEWQKLIKECKFNVIHMKGKFLDVSQLATNHKFRKVDCHGNKFSWLAMKWLRVSHGSSIMEYKTSCSPDEPVRKIDFSRSAEIFDDELDVLYKEPLKISNEKYKDIISLADYIPNCFSKYFKEIPHEEKLSHRYENLPDEASVCSSI